MQWLKKGLIYQPPANCCWAVQGAAVPTVLSLNDSVLRIYVGMRDQSGCGRIRYIDIDSTDPCRILNVATEPVLDVGAPGMFDDSGVLPVSIVEDAGVIYLYYAGFQLGVKIDFTHLSGVAVSVDGGNRFERVRCVPILERTESELFLRSAPHVIKDGAIWKMWYIGFGGWTTRGPKRIYRSKINYLESSDGIHWPAVSTCCLAPDGNDEFGFGRPFVYLDNDVYKMFYSLRTWSKGYRLGYAESPDGIEWRRMDESVGIDVSKDGWDSKDICWSAIIRSQGRTLMFYNGNSYGRTGFGYAVLASPTS